MMAGKIKPNIDKQTAPTKEMKGPRLGTATAIPTKKKYGKLAFFKLKILLENYILTW